MNPFRREHLATGLLVGSSTLATMTAFHFHRYDALQADRLAKETRRSDQLKELLSRHDLLIGNRRKEYDQMVKQTKLMKEMIEKKQLHVDRMKSLVQECHQLPADHEDTLRLSQKIEQYLIASDKMTLTHRSSGAWSNKTDPELPRRTSSARHLRVAQMIDFFEQK